MYKKAENQLTVQAMIHSLGDRKCLAMSVVATVMFVPNSTCFPFCIDSTFFEKVVYRIALDACLEKKKVCDAINNNKKDMPFLFVACHAMTRNLDGEGPRYQGHQLEP